jgi:metal-responsive CopG/Arc/MetJ family transcriptional regulator
MVTRVSNRKNNQISISIKKELIELADQVARETNTNRSKVISDCLEELARQRKEQLMIKYYQYMDSEKEKFLNNTQRVISDIVAGWGD